MLRCSNGVVGNEAMPPASVRTCNSRRISRAQRSYPALSVWCIFGAGQGRLGTRKRNRCNDLDLVCVHLEGRCSIQLSYGRYTDFKRFQVSTAILKCPFTALITDFLTQLSEYYAFSRTLLGPLSPSVPRA
jgi:hypothetical protein